MCIFVRLRQAGPHSPRGSTESPDNENPIASFALSSSTLRFLGPMASYSNMFGHVSPNTELLYFALTVLGFVFYAESPSRPL